MESLDLNIDHYSIDDIISLFKITNKLSPAEMKAAKRIVLMSHPDKSRLDSKYFLFFKKAYKILFSIYTHKYKSDETEECVSRSRNRDDKETEVSINENLSRLSSRNKCDKDFSVWFNKFFEENKQGDDIEESGYGEWLQQEVDTHANENKEGPISKDKRDDIINQEKVTLRALAVYKDVNEIDGHVAERIGHSSLISRDTVDYYGSGIFSNNNLSFDDVKHAYTETVIPVTEKDFYEKKKYRDINHLQNERGIDQRGYEFLTENQEKDETRTIFEFYSK